MKKRMLEFLQIAMMISLMFILNQGQTPAANERVIFENGNIYTVYNGPTSPTKFTLRQPSVITSIVNYHWNAGQGSEPGTIGLEDSTGVTYGPWQTTGSPGQGGVPDAYWTATPNIKLPAGEYTVIDSEEATWSQNSGSNNSGFTIVKGYLWKPTAPRTLVATVENQSRNNVLIWQDPFEPKSMMDVLNYHLEPGWKGSLKLKIPADGEVKFVAGSGGPTDTGQYNKVLASCLWTDDPANTSRIPYIVFDSNGNLSCGDGKK